MARGPKFEVRGSKQPSSRIEPRTSSDEPRSSIYSPKNRFIEELRGRLRKKPLPEFKFCAVKLERAET